MKEDLPDDLLDDLAGSPGRGQRFEHFDLGTGDLETRAMEKMVRTLRRSTLTRDAVVSLDEVIEAVGGRAAVVRAWVKSSVSPLRHPSGRLCYRWGDVLDAMQRGGA